MGDNHIHHCLRYEFDRGTNSKLALKNIQDTYGNDSLTDSACRQYFKKLRSEKNEERENENSEIDSRSDNEPENKPVPVSYVYFLLLFKFFY